MKSYTIDVLKPAELEIKEACEWYEKRQQGLAADLLNEISYNFERISKNPLLFPIRYNGTHRAGMLKKFPYLIVFRIDDTNDTAYVVSFFHTSRSPLKVNLG